MVKQKPEPKREQRRDRCISVVLTVAEKAELEARAEKENRSISQTTRRAIAQYLAKEDQ